MRVVSGKSLLEVSAATGTTYDKKLNELKKEE